MRARALAPIFAAILVVSGGAAADAPVDTVFLKNGGRVRGQIMEETRDVVSLMMLDGTTRKIPRAEVDRVAYAGSATAHAAPPTAAPPAAQTTAPASPPPQCARDTDCAEGMACDTRDQCVPASSLQAPALVPTPVASPGQATGPSEGFPASANPSRRHLLYVVARVGGGYWHYDQSAFAPREIGGGLVEAVGTFGLSPGLGFVLGAQVGFQLTFPSTGTEGAGTTEPLEGHFAPGGFFGGMAAWVSDPERPLIGIELAGGFGGAGDPKVWGGFGPYVSPNVALYFLHARRSHLGFDLGFHYAPLYSSDAPGAVKSLVQVTGGFRWLLY